MNQIQQDIENSLFMMARLLSFSGTIDLCILEPESGEGSPMIVLIYYACLMWDIFKIAQSYHSSEFISTPSPLNFTVYVKPC